MGTFVTWKMRTAFTPTDFPPWRGRAKGFGCWMVLGMFVGGEFCCWVSGVWTQIGFWTGRGGGIADRALSFTYILEFNLHLRNIRKNFSPGSWEELGIFLWTALLPSRCYWSSDCMNSGGFGQHKFLPSCGAEGSPYQLMAVFREQWDAYCGHHPTMAHPLVAAGVDGL
jgi:hypothetical protein